MVSITLQLEKKFKSEIEHFSWINWSAVAREEVMKKVIFENYVKTRKLSKEEQRFCDKIDWHPVDWLPLKESYIKKLEKIMKGPHYRMTSKKLDKLLGLK